MKYVIRSSKALNRKAKIRIFMRWFFYALSMIFLYMVMASGAFGTFQPPLLIPLALAVAMRESEFSGCIFGIFCGLLCDIAGTDLFGFTCVWLMPCCLAASLLARNLIRVNFLNHLWITALTCFVIGFMDYLFNYLIWDKPNSYIILVSYIIMPLAVAILLSPGPYFLVKLISHKLEEKESRELSDVAQETDEQEAKVRD